MWKVQIREATPIDAERFLKLLLEVESKADYMLFEAGERKTTVDKQRQQLEMIEKQENATILLAEEKGELIGYLITIGGTTNRKKHTAYVVIGVLDGHKGKGIGTALFEQLDEWAIVHNIVRLELTVVTRNEAGVNLYKKMGFEVEGMKRKSFLVKDQFLDEFYMAKIR
ncbi:GNAT family N-acetyltransferase [Gottfriedia solisilvae]|uniref:GNAT family N-acetyltransferase n=1 Tax=Gottfriedia solisilvae TaxID=1516104 RepID=UPI001F2D38DF|nr:GNAT family N-acetyltransferase [Gottfriedia solisilvae]